MSLRAFHLFFIAVSVLMHLLVGGWGIQQYFEAGSGGGLVLGIVCFVLGFGLVLYGVKAYRKLREIGD